MAVADETAQMLEYSSQLEDKSAELTRTARQLRDANEKLQDLSVQKDAFLSQISHELRTPMTSIRAFSEILMDGPRAGAEAQVKYSSIIHDETMRLTRLLDDLLDLSVLENGSVSLNYKRARLQDVLDRAVSATPARYGAASQPKKKCSASSAPTTSWTERTMRRLSLILPVLLASACGSSGSSNSKCNSDSTPPIERRPDEMKLRWSESRSK